MADVTIFGDLVSSGAIEVPEQITVEVPVGKPNPKTKEQRTKKETRNTNLVLLEYQYQIKRRAKREKQLKEAEVRLSKTRFEDIDKALDELTPFIEAIEALTTTECVVKPTTSGDSGQRKTLLEGENALRAGFATAPGAKVLISGVEKEDTVKVGTFQVLQDQESAGASTLDEEEPAEGDAGPPSTQSSETAGTDQRSAPDADAPAKAGSR